MNDDDVMTAVRQPLAEVHMTTPLDDVVRHGKSLRNRRWLRGTCGVTALAGAIAVAAALLVPGGSSTPPPWTVTKVSDDTIKVSIHDLRDPEGLQKELRADGIRARVTFDSLSTPPSIRAHDAHLPKVCIPYRGTGGTFPDNGNMGSDLGYGYPTNIEFTLSTSDYPSGSGIVINAAAAIRIAKGEPNQHRTLVRTWRVVDTPKCLGS